MGAVQYSTVSRRCSRDVAGLWGVLGTVLRRADTYVGWDCGRYYWCGSGDGGWEWEWEWEVGVLALVSLALVSVSGYV